MALTRTETRTATVRLPRAIYDQAKRVLEKEKGDGSQSRISLNDLIVTAVKAYLKMHKRREIDLAFAGMAEDAAYQKQARLLTEDFEHSDWEALRLGERDLEGEPSYAGGPAR